MFHHLIQNITDTLVAPFHRRSEPKWIDASSTELAYVGRVVHAADGGVGFRLPGVQIHARFFGTSVAMEITPRNGYFMVELDDRTPYKLKCNRDEAITEIASALPRTEHRLTLTYCNEGNTETTLVFRGLLLDGRGKMLPKPELPKRRIEFIGDSITCGYGVEDESEEKAFPFPSVSNAYYSFAQQTARRLGAQCVQVSRSGICLHYDRIAPGMGIFHNLRTCYPYTLFWPEDGAEVWDSRKYVPDVVCINLGTNDTGQAEFEGSVFADSYAEFVHDLRSRYPEAKIVMLSGPMCHDANLAKLISALNAVEDKLKAEGDTQVFRFDFTPTDGSLGYGTCKHPSLLRQTRMAEELEDFLRKLMKW